MKLKLAGMAAIGLASTAISLAQNETSGDAARRVASPAVSAGVASAAAKNSSGTEAAGSAALTRSDALKLVAAARHYVAHPSADAAPGAKVEPQVTTPDFDIPTPPPEARTEVKPAAPAPGWVWVAGHYMPVKGEWRWVRGEWALPPLPICVWVPAQYDAKAGKWSPGYWQPDANDAPPSESGAKTDAAAGSVPGYN